MVLLSILISFFSTYFPNIIQGEKTIKMHINIIIIINWLSI